VVKNKIAPPFREAEFDIMHNEGISKTGAVIDAAVNLGVITKNGTWLSYEDKKLGQGRDAAMKFLKENPKLQEDIERETRKKFSLAV
jgi:recombination protein RecA